MKRKVAAFSLHKDTLLLLSTVTMREAVGGAKTALCTNLSECCNVGTRLSGCCQSETTQLT